jgi:WD40 repeat protein
LLFFNFIFLDIAWHPVNESLFSTGSGDGSIMFWSALCEKNLGSLVGAHDGLCLSLDWHPVGHVLASGSLDSSVRFWIRQRPADSCLDQYVLGKQAAEAMGIKNTEPTMAVAEEDDDGRDDEFIIPGVNRQGSSGGGNRRRY